MTSPSPTPTPASTYSVTYPGNIQLTLTPSSLQVSTGQGDTTDISDVDNVDQPVTDANGFEYQLQGMNLYRQDAASSDLPVFPVSASCANSLPPSTPAPGVSITAWVFIGLLFAVIAAIIFLLFYRGQNSYLLRAKSWITGRTRK